MIVLPKRSVYIFFSEIVTLFIFLLTYICKATWWFLGWLFKRLFWQGLGNYLSSGMARLELSRLADDCHDEAGMVFARGNGTACRVSRGYLYSCSLDGLLAGKPNMIAGAGGHKDEDGRKVKLPANVAVGKSVFRRRRAAGEMYTGAGPSAAVCFCNFSLVMMAGAGDGSHAWTIVARSRRRGGEGAVAGGMMWSASGSFLCAILAVNPVHRIRCFLVKFLASWIHRPGNRHKVRRRETSSNNTSTPVAPASPSCPFLVPEVGSWPWEATRRRLTGRCRRGQELNAGGAMGWNGGACFTVVFFLDCRGGDPPILGGDETRRRLTGGWRKQRRGGRGGRRKKKKRRETSSFKQGWDAWRFVRRSASPPFDYVPWFVYTSRPTTYMWVPPFYIKAIYSPLSLWPPLSLSPPARTASLRRRLASIQVLELGVGGSDRDGNPPHGFPRPPAQPQGNDGEAWPPTRIS